MSANDFKITIGAEDRYTKTFDDLQKKAGKAASGVGDALVEKMGGAFKELASSGQELSRSVGIIGPGFLNMFRGAGPAAAATGVAATISAITSKVGLAGLGVQRTAQAFGMATDDLQRFRGAAKLTGLSVEAMDNSLESMGRTMQDAANGRNDLAMALLRQYQIGVPRLPNGTLDRSTALIRMSKAVTEIKDPNAQELFARHLGVSDLLPLLRQGPEAIKALSDQAEKLGYVLKGPALEASQRFTAELFEAQVATDSLTNALGVRFLPSITNAVKAINLLVEKPEDFTKRFTSGLVNGMYLDSLNGVNERKAANPDKVGVVALSPDAASRSQAMGLTGMARRLNWGDIDSQYAEATKAMFNNNPGNLRKWGDQPIVGGFAKFDTPMDGLTAMAKQLMLYDARGINTVGSIVNRWAPPSDHNPTAAYIANVSQRTGFAPDQPLNLHDPAQLAPLLSAMVRQEKTGQPFSQEQYRQAAETVLKVEFSGLPAGVRASATLASQGGPFKMPRVAYNTPATDIP